MKDHSTEGGQPAPTVAHTAEPGHSDPSPESEPFGRSVVAGFVAALIGVISFGIFHTLWVRNIPTVFVEGLLYTIPAAFALGWAMRTTRRSGTFGHGLRHGVLLGFLFWLALIPYEIAGAFWGPWPNPQGAGEVLALLWIAFLGVPVGALFGWLLTRRARGALAWAVAILAIDFSLGGGLAFNGGRGNMLGLFFWMLPTNLLAGLALVALHGRRAVGRPSESPAGGPQHVTPV